MMLFIDANLIVGNPLLRGRQWDAVGDAVVSETLDLYISELAIAEAVERYRVSSEVRVRDLKKSLNKWARPSRGHLMDAITESRLFTDNYEHALRARISALGAVVVEYPDVDHQEIAERAIKRKAPFDHEGNGYRDALHWYSFLGILADIESEDPFAFFLSNDKKAFGPQQQLSLLDDVEQLGTEWEVSFLYDLAEFKVPGQFLDEEEYLDAIQDRDLRDAVRDGLTQGGVPDDFTHIFAAKAGYDNAQIVEVIHLAVDALSVQRERKSRDLWISYSAHATCRIEFETIEVYDEQAGDYERFDKEEEWEIWVSGFSLTSGSSIDEVASLRLDGFNSQDDDSDVFPHS